MCLGLNFSFQVPAFKSWIDCSAISASVFSYEMSVITVLIGVVWTLNKSVYETS